MSPVTTIEWATHVWNPFTGCDRVSPGCANCYAATSAASLKLREQGRIAAARRDGRPEPTTRYQRDGDRRSSGPGFGFTVHWDKLENPERFPAGARVFVNSMSDVFHEDAPFEAIDKIFEAAILQPTANFLILTKRPERMLEYFLHGADYQGLQLEDLRPWPNVWLGVSIENRRFVHRADLLRQTPAAVRFISAEPLLGPLVHNPFKPQDWNPLSLVDIDWLIVGGESGAKHRRIDREWVRDLQCACRGERRGPGGDEVLVPPTSFFFKQWGGRRAKEGGRELDGRTWDEIPAGLPVAGRA